MDILFAQTAPGSGNSFLQWLPFIMMFLIIYLFMIRPQFKQQKEKKLMLENLKKGDRVITSGGIYGTIAGFKEKNNVVLSRKAVLEGVHSEEKAKLLEGLKEDQIMEGVVKNLTDYGAFIDLGGIDGLLHITDISWSRINHPSEALEVGQKLKVKVIKYDKDEQKVSLGAKQLKEDPWIGIESKLPLRTSVMAKVTNLTDYGFFAEIEAGVEGLVHVSEIDWTNKNIHPSKIVQVGDSLEVMILEVDEEKRRISLGVKQLSENPWQVFAHKYKEGEKITGEIKSITDFGIFMGLDGGIDGLVHLKDVSWEEEDIVTSYEKGQQIETIILSIDAERERISLGVKQLQADAFNDFVSSNKKGSRVSGKVIDYTDDKIFLSLSEEIKGNTPGDQFGIFADIGSIKKEIGWEPKYTIDIGLKNMVQHYCVER